MSKGYRKHQERLDAVHFLGKTLVRRSGSKCELCGIAGEKLTIMEVEPVPENPSEDHAIFLCDACHEGCVGGKLQPMRWRFLESVVWSEIPAVQVTAVRICRRLQHEKVDWADDLLSGLYLSPEVEEWLG